MAVLNSTVLESAWLSGSNDFQQRIPNPAISGYARTVAAIFEPYNNDMYNEFSQLLNGIMGTFVESRRFENPLRELKKPAAEFGNTERHVAVKYLQAHGYRYDAETLLKVEMPEYVEWFYSVQKPRQYRFTWNRFEMQRAFAEEGYGFDNLLTATLNQQISSDNYDEMNIMLQMFAEGDARFDGGLYRENISAAPTTQATAQELLVKIRAAAGRLKFPSTLYNHIDVPVHENGDSLIVWLTPEVAANIDVMALAAAFNIDRAEIQYRVIVIPEFPIPNVYAAITSEDFIYARDVYYAVETGPYDPVQLAYKYVLTHAEMIGVNPAANCILFTTDAASEVPVITMNITGLTLGPVDAMCEIGGTLQLTPMLSGTVSPDNTNIFVEPNSVGWSVYRLVDSDAVQQPQNVLNSRTYVDDNNVLHVQKSHLQAGMALLISATATYVNPSGETAEYTEFITVALSDPVGTGAKQGVSDTDPYITWTGNPDTAYND